MKPIKRHICYVTPEFPDVRLRKSAGIGQSVFNLATALTELNHRVTVVVYGQDCAFEEVISGIRIIVLKRNQIAFYHAIIWRLELARFLLKLHKKLCFDVIESVDYEGATALVSSRLPVVIKIHGSLSYFDFLAGKKPQLSYYVAERLALKRAKLVVAVSEFAAETTKRSFNLQFSYKVLYNGVSIVEYSDQIVPNTLLYFGSLIEKKGFFELATIFNLIASQNQDVIIQIAGADRADAEGSSSLKRFMDLVDLRYRKKVKYLGNLSQSELQNVIKKASVCVFPSFAEALPMAWLETMAAGKAMVASNMGWANEMLKSGETAFLCNPKEHKKFADYTLKLLSDDKLCNTFGTLARQEVRERFSMPVVVAKHLEVYGELVNQSKS